MSAPGWGWRSASVRRIAVILAVLAAGAVARMTWAEGIPVGKWIFYPSVDAAWQTEDNLFLTPDDPESAISYVVRPRLLWELPFRESDLKLTYEPQVREFVGRGGDEERLSDRYFSHLLEADTKLVFASGLRIQARDEFIIDTLETGRLDAGGEVVFNNDEFRRNRAELEILKELGAIHSAGVQAVYERLDFGEQEVPAFLNYERSAAGIVYVYRLGPATQLRTSYAVGEGQQDRPPLLALGDTVDFRSLDGRVSLQTAVGRRGLLDATLGYVRWDFDNSAQDDFSGVTGNLRHRLQIAERMFLSTVLSKHVLPSFFNVNSYYVARSVSTNLTHDVGSHLFYSGTVLYRLNDYPESLTDSIGAVIGPRREDRAWRAEAGLGYKFSEALRVEARYRRESRSSNIDTLNYDASRLLAQLSFGWR